MLLGALGRPVHCSMCGQQLFVALPFVRRGELRLIGAADRNVRVSFVKEESLEFRHLELDSCPAPERPWLS
jgi:hypothetical protein